MFGIDESKYPRNWKEMSFDFKLFFVYHGCMMLLLATSALLPVFFQIACVSVLLLTFLALSVKRRIRMQWHWPGTGVRNVLGAIFSVALGVFFLGSVTPRVSPLDPRLFPWFAAGGGIVLFWILYQLKLVFFSEKDFLSHCGERIATEPKPATAPTEPTWKRFLRSAFYVYFFAVWTAGVTFFWKYNIAFRDGSPEPTPTQTETLVDHGNTVYITAEEKRVVSILEKSMFVGIPSALLLATLLQFVVGVKLFPHVPSLRGRRRQVT